MSNGSEAASTMSALLRKLGDVPTDRVLLHPAPGTATEDDVIWYEGRADKRLCELIDGTLVQKTGGFRESAFTVFVGVHLLDAVLPANFGIVTGPDGMFWTVTGRIRCPDVAYFAWDRFPDGVYPTEPIPHVVPNLVVEILSPFNTPAEMRMKREDYFASGVELVWEMDLVSRSVAIFTGVDEWKVATVEDELDGGIVLPEFRISLARLVRQS